MKTQGAALGGRARTRHQLSTLLTEAYQSRESLEEKIAQGRRNRKEAGNKYGKPLSYSSCGWHYTDVVPRLLRAPTMYCTLRLGPVMICYTTVSHALSHFHVTLSRTTCGHIITKGYVIQDVEYPNKRRGIPDHRRRLTSGLTRTLRDME